MTNAPPGLEELGTPDPGLPPWAKIDRPYRGLRHTIGYAMFTLNRILLLLVVCWVLLAPTIAFATEAGGEAKKPWSQQAGSFIDIHRYDLGIYTLIVFGLLFLILAKFAWKPFTEGLAKREAVIASARDEALKAKHDAEQLQIKLKAEFDKAHEQIRGMIDEARRDADALRAKEREAGQRDAAAERERARREIETQKEQLKQELTQHAVQLAAMMSSKALRRNMSADDHARLVDESLAELNAAR